MEATHGWVIFFSVIVFSVLALLIFAFWFGWWHSRFGQGKSPFTGLPLRRATDLSYYSAEKVLRFLYDKHQYDNRIFKLKKAAFCRETGRIFQDCVTWYDAVIVDWDFLQKRYSGAHDFVKGASHVAYYVSWGSLNEDQQYAIRQVHLSLENFQTEKSSPSPSPRAVESEYAFTKPGPLYVDLETKVLLGWQIVPGTELELLIVQKPIKS